MKRLSVIKNKISTLFVKTMATLSLGIVLQAKHCPLYFSENRGAHYNILKKLDSSTVCNYVNGLKEDVELIDKAGDTVLYAAVELNSSKTVFNILEYLDKYFKPNKSLDNFTNAFHKQTGYTPLGRAIKKGSLDICKMLMGKFYIDTNQAQLVKIDNVKYNKSDQINISIKEIHLTSLVLALLNKREKIAKLLLDHPNVDFRTPDPVSGATPLCLAISNNLTPIALSLILKLPEEDLKLENKQGESPLYLAIKGGLKSVAKALIDKLPAIEVCVDKARVKHNLLHEIIKKKWEDLAILMLNKLKEEDLTLNKQGEIALYLAIEYKLQHVAKALIRKLPAIEVCVDKKRVKHNLLHEIIKKKWEDLAILMLNKLKKEDLTLNKQGEIALYLAIEYKLEHIAQALIRKLPAIKRLLHEKGTEKDLLDMAIKNGREWQNTAKLLIDKLSDEDLTLTNKKSKSSLCLAVKNNLGIVVDSLLPRLYSIEDFVSKNKKKKGPLHLAARNNNGAMLRKIAERIYELVGKDYNKLIDIFFSKDANGYTVFASAFLPRNKTERLIHIRNHNSDMFKDLLYNLINKDNLTMKHLDMITNEINSLETKRTINQEYAHTLRTIVYSVKDNSAVKPNQVIPSERTPLIAAVA